MWRPWKRRKCIIRSQQSVSNCHCYWIVVCKANLDQRGSLRGKRKREKKHSLPTTSSRYDETLFYIIILVEIVVKRVIETALVLPFRSQKWEQSRYRLCYHFGTGNDTNQDIETVFVVSIQKQLCNRVGFCVTVSGPEMIPIDSCLPV
jgi:hypothetical protein